MTRTTKIVIAVACGAVCGGLGVAAGIYPTFAAVFASFSAGTAALGTIVTGFSVTSTSE